MNKLLGQISHSRDCGLEQGLPLLKFVTELFDLLLVLQDVVAQSLQLLLTGVVLQAVQMLKKVNDDSGEASNVRDVLAGRVGDVRYLGDTTSGVGLHPSSLSGSQVIVSLEWIHF